MKLQKEIKVSKKFLGNLSGLTPESAEAAVSSLGLKANIIPHGVAASMIARFNTVNIWLNPNGLVSKATKGW